MLLLTRTTPPSTAPKAIAVPLRPSIPSCAFSIPAMLAAVSTAISTRSVGKPGYLVLNEDEVMNYLSGRPQEIMVTADAATAKPPFHQPPAGLRILDFPTFEPETDPFPKGISASSDL